jgi:tRNA(fMet)-specific endonuclease VapC
MAGTSRLLDTNIVVAILNQEEKLLEQVAEVTAYIPSIVLGELYYGARKSARSADNIKRIETLLEGYVVLACDEATAVHYGQIKLELRLKGRPIPENDIWIAAVARQHELVLVTRDGHFAAVDKLKTEAW